MIKTKPLPDQEKLLQSLDYNPETGILTWRTSNRGHKAGVEAGCRLKDGVWLKIGRTLYRASRVIWKMVHNEEPPEIDHKDLDKQNTKLNNLRAATHGQNTMNRPKSWGKRTPVKGVGKRKGKYTAVVHVEGKRVWLGTFDTFEEAKTVREIVAAEAYGEFNRP